MNEAFENRKIMKSFDFGEEQMVNDFMTKDSIMYNGMSLLKPLSKIYHPTPVNGNMKSASTFFDKDIRPKLVTPPKSAYPEFQEKQCACKCGQNKRVVKQMDKQEEKSNQYQSAYEQPVSSECTSVTAITQKRRGRKRERDDLYFIRAEERIVRLKE